MQALAGWRRLLVAGFAVSLFGGVFGGEAHAQEGQVHAPAGAQVVDGSYIVTLKAGAAAASGEPRTRSASTCGSAVAGAAALLLSQSPNLTPAEVTTTPLGRATTGVLEAADLGAGSPNKLLYTGVPPRAVCALADDTRRPVSDQGSVTSTLQVKRDGINPYTDY